MMAVKWCNIHQNLNQKAKIIYTKTTLLSNSRFKENKHNSLVCVFSLSHLILRSVNFTYIAFLQLNF